MYVKGFENNQASPLPVVRGASASFQQSYQDSEHHNVKENIGMNSFPLREPRGRESKEWGLIPQLRYKVRSLKSAILAGNQSQGQNVPLNGVYMNFKQ